MSKPYSQKWKLSWEEEKGNDVGKLKVVMFFNGYYDIGIILVRVREWKSKHPTSGGGILGYAKCVTYQLVEGDREQCIRETIRIFDLYDIDECVAETLKNDKKAE